VSDERTIRVYDARARDYAARFSADADADTQLQHFMDHLPARAAVLDLGCGPGRSAAIMARAGHDVTATDASAEMVALAAAHPGVTARQERFDDLTGDTAYDGIWANFSLLHAEEDALPRHLAAIARALKPGGLFHIGMKLGQATARDSLGRRYLYVTEDGLESLLTGAGLTPFARWTGRSPGLAGTDDPWIVMQARKDKDA
jgi:SAM-dependent methyltransferase